MCLASRYVQCLSFTSFILLAFVYRSLIIGLYLVATLAHHRISSLILPRHTVQMPLSALQHTHTHSTGPSPFPI
ncbi:hypothetical protein BDW22DRAFT_159064 [Trametopsis cervina]|nr:hypothetical protein BDW22DRAFT_159064 [Trametopsis cervina]